MLRVKSNFTSYKLPRNEWKDNVYYNNLGKEEKYFPYKVKNPVVLHAIFYLMQNEPKVSSNFINDNIDFITQVIMLLNMADRIVHGDTIPENVGEIVENEEEKI